MAPFDVLRAYLTARAAFTAADFEFIQGLCLVRHLPAGAALQRAGDVPTHAAFVAAGCLRSYVIDARGKEHVIQFAPETWWLSDNPSLMNRQPSQYFFDAVEDSDLILLDPAAQARILAEVPAYARAFQAGLQKHAAAKDQRIVNALSTSAEERYLEFLKTYPALVPRVPQFMLASYLGVTPETVSRIRKQLSRK